MKSRTIVAALLSLVLGVGIAAFADDAAPTTQPTTQNATTKAKKPKKPKKPAATAPATDNTPAQ
jgi:hypothetical protein